MCPSDRQGRMTSAKVGRYVPESPGSRRYSQPRPQNKAPNGPTRTIRLAANSHLLAGHEEDDGGVCATESVMGYG